MAQRIEVILVDDIDGGSADHTLTFGLDGKMYEIDLSDKHAEQLRADVQRWADKGRRVKAAAAKTPTSREAKTPTKHIRAWAKANGHEVGDFGRIPPHIQEAYAASLG